MGPTDSLAIGVSPSPPQQSACPHVTLIPKTSHKSGDPLSTLKLENSLKFEFQTQDSARLTVHGRIKSSTGSVVLVYKIHWWWIDLQRTKTANKRAELRGEGSWGVRAWPSAVGKGCRWLWKGRWKEEWCSYIPCGHFLSWPGVKPLSHLPEESCFLSRRNASLCLQAVYFLNTAFLSMCKLKVSPSEPFLPMRRSVSVNKPRWNYQRKTFEVACASHVVPHEGYRWNGRDSWRQYKCLTVSARKLTWVGQTGSLLGGVAGERVKWQKPVFILLSYEKVCLAQGPAL